MIAFTQRVRVFVGWLVLIG